MPEDRKDKWLYDEGEVMLLLPDGRRVPHTQAANEELQRQLDAGMTYDP